MCGIIAYNGEDDAIPYLLEGIKNLEYRGYDSFGCALESKGGITIKKDIGRVENVIKKYQLQKLSSKKAVFHTRWATHGGVKQENAHPIMDCTGRIAVAHNGIIENWEELRDTLKGTHDFVSGTDTEALAHLIEEKLNGGESLTDAVSDAFSRIKGYSSFVVLDRKTNELVAVKNGSPLVLGLAEKGNFIASDVPSFVKHTNKVVYLYDGDLVSVGKKDYKITNVVDKNIKHRVATVDLSAEDAEKGDYEHFMLKEIMEQPGLLKNLETSDLSEVNRAANAVKKAHLVYLVGAGTSFHAARIGSRILRESSINAMPIQGQDLPSYKKVIDKNDVFIIISQSGETADIIKYLPVIRKNKKIGIINVEGSKLANEVDILIKVGAGPEKAVASTKTFTLSAVYAVLIALFATGKKKEAMRELSLMNINMYNLLVPSVMDALDRAAYRVKDLESVLFLGRDYDYILALEGALKLKEIAYIHAEAIEASTFKHGPLALVSENTYAVVILSPGNRNETMYNIQEFKARNGKIIGIAENNAEPFDLFIRTQNGGVFTFVMHAILLQLLAYKIAEKKALDIDHPRNLAKSVTTL